MSADTNRHRPHHDTSHFLYSSCTRGLLAWVNCQEHEMGRSYMVGERLYGCPVEGVTEWIHLVGRGRKI
jgi:hypothetical protein